MEKKLLIAVDGSHAAELAVDYVGLMEGAMIRELRVTLFHVMSPLSPDLARRAEADPLAFRQVAELRERNLGQAHQALESAQRILLRHGLGEDQVELKAHPRVADTARDILFEAEQGLYDAVVLGRRGLSKTQELFLGSVTNQVVQHADRLPVWVVGGRIASLKVLCAVDGSEGSLKAVDHLAFMLGGNPECRVTLLHVGAALATFCPVDFSRRAGEPAPQAPEDAQVNEGDEDVCMDGFYARALAVLKEGGLEEDQVEVWQRPGRLGVAGAIMDEIRAGDFGTVVLGRRGQNRSFFLGHVSDRVLGKGGEVAVWVVG
jgi:nucleotide-binding universal stress UspA family protein